MTATYTQANLILNRGFGAATWTPPGTMYIGLSKTAINPDGTGATEPSGGSYARASIVNDKTTGWNNASNGALTNKAIIQFAEATSDWSTSGAPITTIFIADAVSGGNILYYDTLSPSRIIQTGSTVNLQAGTVTVSMA